MKGRYQCGGQRRTPERDVEDTSKWRTPASGGHQRGCASRRGNHDSCTNEEVTNEVVTKVNHISVDDASGEDTRVKDITVEDFWEEC